jgi:3-oxo-4-pregnene-20-carboxyl-CoA dehydrogenase alpha subunit
MDTVLPDHVAELAATARRAFADAGGVDLARRAETDPGVRATAVDVVAALGGWELEPSSSADEALAAFALCREAGRVVLPVPLEARLCRTDRAAVALVDPADPLVEHADLLDDLVAVGIDGTTFDASVAGPRLGSRLGPFMVPVTLAPRASSDALAAAGTTALVLGAATVLGTVEAAIDRCVEHVTERHQFGQRIADFQAVQFQVADAVVAANGLAELSLFTAWRLTELGAGARTDALALRLHAADVARTALRTAQQLHGASGVAEEYDVSVLCRRVQAGLRSPASPERVLDVLTGAIRDDGFTSLFPHGSASARAGEAAPR